MINYDYTLLMNTSDTAGMDSDTWYIDRDFHGVNIPADMAIFDKLIFPCYTKDDRNYYAMCYIDLLHSLDIIEYTNSLGGLYTYNLDTQDHKKQYDTRVVITTSGDVNKDIGYTFNAKTLNEKNLYGVYSWRFTKEKFSQGRIEGYNINKRIELNNHTAIRIELIPDVFTVFVPYGPEFVIDMKLVNYKQFDIQKISKSLDSYIVKNSISLNRSLFKNDKHQHNVDKLYELWKLSYDVITRVGAMVCIYLLKLDELNER